MAFLFLGACAGFAIAQIIVLSRRVANLERLVSSMGATLDDHGIYSDRPPVGLDAPPQRER